MVWQDILMAEAKLKHVRALSKRQLVKAFGEIKRAIIICFSWYGKDGHCGTGEDIEHLRAHSSVRSGLELGTMSLGWDAATDEKSTTGVRV